MITLSPYVKPTTKKCALSLLSGVIATMQDNGNESAELTAEQLESLYRYFLPATPKVAKTAFDWVAKACSHKDSREFAKYVHADGHKIVATDGHRLHWASDDRQPGVYDPKSGCRVTVDIVCPDFNRIIKPFHGECAYLADLPEAVTKHNGKDTLCFMLPCGNAVQKAYLIAATNDHDSFKWALGDDKSPIRGISEFGEFVIMPIATK